MSEAQPSERRWRLLSNGKMSLVSGRDLGAELCKALGLDPMWVSHMTLDLDSAAVSTVVVTMYVTDTVTDELTQVMRRYRLVPTASLDLEMSAEDFARRHYNLSTEPSGPAWDDLPPGVRGQLTGAAALMMEDLGL